MHSFVSQEPLILSAFWSLRQRKLYQEDSSETSEAMRNSPNRVLFGDILAVSLEMQDVLENARLVSRQHARVLLTGPTGVGKELLARAVHFEGPRRDKPFVAVNCGAIPERLAETELFGHEKGAFTNAHKRRKGCFELADEGTIFLDEVTSLPPDIQVKILRVIENGVFRRVGGEKPVYSNVRIISATNCDLSLEVRAGRFRDDLFYRLAAFPISVPPLRNRPEDIPVLLDHYLARSCSEQRRPRMRVSSDALHHLCAYGWPGNVRELEHLIEQIVIRESGPAICTEHLPGMMISDGSNRKTEQRGFVPLASFVEEARRSHILRALQETQWNQLKAARLLGVSRTTLWKGMQKYGLLPPAENSASSVATAGRQEIYGRT